MQRIGLAEVNKRDIAMPDAPEGLIRDRQNGASAGDHGRTPGAFPERVGKIAS